MAYRHTLTDAEKRELLRIARVTLDEHLHSGQIPPGKPHSGPLTDNAAAFVTLHTEDGALRGCIGTSQEIQPLYLTVQNMAVAAATRDPRFNPVTLADLCDLVIEVSVLSDHTIITRSDEVIVGQHGVSVTASGSRGLLLPQVAPEYGWSSETLLAKTCAKAGLPTDAWQNPDAVVERFTAQAFAETEFAPV